jgi:DNA-binding PadR family transcriptional regulator
MQKREKKKWVEKSSRSPVETDGNLGTYLRKPEEAKYVEVRKEFADRKPVIWYRITPAGAQALRARIAALEMLVSSTSSSPSS